MCKCLIIIAFFLLHVLTGWQLYAQKSASKSNHDSLYVCTLLDKAWDIQSKNYEQALDFLNTADSVSSTLNHPNLIASCMSSRAVIYENMGDFDKALDFHFKALQLVEKIHESKLIAISLNNIGNAYFKKNNFKKALEYYSKSVIIKQKLPTSKTSEGSIAVSFGNLGIVYENLQNFDSAVYFQKAALAIRQKINDSLGIGTSLANIAKLNYSLNNFDVALRYNRDAYPYIKACGNLVLLAQWYKNMASNFFKLNQLNSAQLYVDSGIDLSRKIKARQVLLESLFLSSKIQHAGGNYKKSTDLLFEYKFLNDTLQQENNESLATSAEALYKNLKKDKEFEFLKQENELHKITLAKNRLYFLIIAIVVIVFFLLLVFYIRQRRLIQQKQKLELEQKLLRAQMNPHFLFNALNSIQSLILDDDKKVAYEYHGKFSKLMRMILMHTREEKISLKDEISALKLYMEIEMLRTDNKFSFNIDAQQVDLEQVKIPAMLIQPFVENSIWHGIINKAENGFIDIRISIEKAMLKIEISDNGIGRQAALEIKKNKGNTHKSIGLDLTIKRIESLSARGGKSDVKFIDLVSQSGEASGTKVEILIPV